MKHTMIMIACLFLLAAITAPSVAQDNVPMTIRAIGLQVIDTDFPSDSFDMRPFNSMSSGTALALLLTSSDKAVVEIIDDDSSLASFTDDTGANLLKEQPQAESDHFSMSDSGISHFPKISADGKLVIIEIKGPSSPASGATSLQLKGKLALQVAAGTEQLTVENAAFTTGPLAVPGHNVAIEEVGEEKDWQDNTNRTITLKLTGDSANQLAGVRFLKPDGSVIESDRSMSMTGFGGAEFTYRLAEMVDAATIELSWWVGLEKVEVPLDMNITLGM